MSLSISVSTSGSVEQNSSNSKSYYMSAGSTLTLTISGCSSYASSINKSCSDYITITETVNSDGSGATVVFECIANSETETNTAVFLYGDGSASTAFTVISRIDCALFSSSDYTLEVGNSLTLSAAGGSNGLTCTSTGSSNLSIYNGKNGFSSDSSGYENAKAAGSLLCDDTLDASCLKLEANGVEDEENGDAYSLTVTRAASGEYTSNSQTITVYVMAEGYSDLTSECEPENGYDSDGNLTYAEEEFTVTFGNILGREILQLYSPTAALGIGTNVNVNVTLIDTDGNEYSVAIDEELSDSDSISENAGRRLWTLNEDDLAQVSAYKVASMVVNVKAISDADDFLFGPYVLGLSVDELESSSKSYAAATKTQAVFFKHTKPTSYYTDIHSEIIGGNELDATAEQIVTAQVVSTDPTGELTDDTEPYTLLQSVSSELATEDSALSELITVNLDEATGQITVSKLSSGTTEHDANTLILTLTWNADYAEYYSDDVVANDDGTYTQTFEIAITANEATETQEAADGTSVTFAYTTELGASMQNEAGSWSSIGTTSLKILDGTAATVQLSGYFEVTTVKEYTSGRIETSSTKYYLANIIANIEHQCDDEDCGFTVSTLSQTKDDDGVITAATYSIQDNLAGANSCAFTFELDVEVSDIRVGTLDGMYSTLVVNVETSSANVPSYIVISDLTDLENAAVNTLRDDYSSWSFASEFTANPSTPTAFYAYIAVEGSSLNTQVVVFYIPDGYTVYTTQWNDDTALSTGASTVYDDPLYILVSGATIRALSLPCGTDTVDERTLTITSDDKEGSCTLIIKRVESLTDYNT